jgi:diguanylate cyclase (GGDEF)-like protein/PAS domain S-box-containing protein
MKHVGPRAKSTLVERAMIERIAYTRFANTGQNRRSIMRHVLNLTSDLIFFIGIPKGRASAPPDIESLRLVDVNQAACSCLVYSKRALLAVELVELVSPSTRELFGHRIRNAYLQPDLPVDAVIQFRSRDGRELLTDATFCYLDASREPLFVLVARDITQRERLEQLLSSPPHVDPLTTLPNRAVLESRFQMAISRAKRRNRRLAVLLIDVDHFKKVNDERGHLAGDAVLRTVAGRLTNCLRERDVVVRYGGDEFVVLVDDLADEIETNKLADRILAAVRAPLTIQNTKIHISVSIGITISNEPTPLPLGLIGKADQAMYRAKALGRDRRYTNYFPQHRLPSPNGSAST